MQLMLWRMGKMLLWAGVALLILIGTLSASPDRTASAEPIEPRGNPAALAASSAFTIGLELVSSGLSAPVHVTNAGDSSGRLFVIEQAGTVRVIKNGALLGAPYLNITAQVACCSEQGLLSIAFDPDFQATRTFYLNYTNLAGNTVIERYTVADATADVANVVSHNVVLTIDQPEANHNGGQLQFGPNDNYLYIGMGDGGGGGDQHGPIGNAQNPAVLLGKMLRINVRGVPTYTIPATNPFTQTVGYRPEIWALGVRNPWRFAFDRANGDLFIGDVGQDCYEEIDYQPGNSAGGQNYGWRQMEGLHPFNLNNFNDCNRAPITPAGLTLPVAEIAHPDGEAIVGGYVYRGNSFPGIQGKYFFADEVTGRLWSMERVTSTWVTTEQAVPTHNYSSFGEDQAGELYIVDYGGGAIYQIVSAPHVSPTDLTTSTKSASHSTAKQGDVITYTIVLRSTGGPLSASTRVTDTLPTGLNYVAGSFVATLGAVQATPPVLKWSGVISATPVVTLSYVTTVSVPGPIGLMNTAEIEYAGNSFNRTATVIVNGVKLYLPLILKLS